MKRTMLLNIWLFSSFPRVTVSRLAEHRFQHRGAQTTTMKWNYMASSVSSCVRVVLSFTTRTRAFSQTADLRGIGSSGWDQNLLGSVKSRAITEDYNGNSVGSYIARITTKFNVCHFEVKARRLSLFHLVPLRMCGGAVLKRPPFREASTT